MPAKAAPSAATADRRQAQLEALLAAAESRIISGGVKGLKARDLAADVGIALGGLYNLVDDMDALLLLISSRTPGAAGRVCRGADGAPANDDAGRGRRAPGCCGIVLSQLRAREPGSVAAGLRTATRQPAAGRGAAQDQLRLFRHIAVPLAAIMPDLDTIGLMVRARTLFAAVHGIVSIGLEERLIAVPTQRLSDEIAWLTRAERANEVGMATKLGVLDGPGYTRHRCRRPHVGLCLGRRRGIGCRGRRDDRAIAGDVRRFLVRSWHSQSLAL